MEERGATWVYCPYCLKGEWCVWKNGYYICPSKNRPFTEQQSIDASKNK